jgi:hypothetical protein
MTSQVQSLHRLGKYWVKSVLVERQWRGFILTKKNNIPLSSYGNRMKALRGFKEEDNNNNKKWRRITLATRLVPSICSEVSSRIWCVKPPERDLYVGRWLTFSVTIPVRLQGLLESFSFINKIIVLNTKKLVIKWRENRWMTTLLSATPRVGMIWLFLYAPCGGIFRTHTHRRDKKVKMKKLLTASGNSSRTAASPWALDRDHCDKEDGSADKADIWTNALTPAALETAATFLAISVFCVLFLEKGK